MRFAGYEVCFKLKILRFWHAAMDHVFSFTAEEIRCVFDDN